MSRALSFNVPGVPQPQGSKRSFRHIHTKKMVVVEDNVKLAPWRETVTYLARNAVVRHGDWLPLEEPVAVGLRFYLPRPATVSRKQRPLPMVKPDIDKLTRAILDSMTAARVYADDARVVELHVHKLYADDRQPGVWVTVEVAENTLM